MYLVCVFAGIGTAVEGTSIQDLIPLFFIDKVGSNAAEPGQGQGSRAYSLGIVPQTPLPLDAFKRLRVSETKTTNAHHTPATAKPKPNSGDGEDEDADTAEAWLDPMSTQQSQVTHPTQESLA